MTLFAFFYPKLSLKNSGYLLSKTKPETETDSGTKLETKTETMNIIKEGNFAVRIPEIPSRYRANCSREWGCFVTGETKNMTASEAEKAGLTRGKLVEMALCWVGQKTLTFEPNYINEPFTEVWGIPIAGEMKSAFHDNASELITFLIHRQSRDRMMGMIEIFGRDAFNEWVAAGMPGDANDFAAAKAAETYFSNIFRFELQRAEGSYGPYFYVASSVRKPNANNQSETAALAIARRIYQGQIDGLGWCTDSRLEENHQACLAALAAPEPQEALSLQQGNNSPKNVKMLKAK